MTRLLVLRQLGLIVLGLAVGWALGALAWQLNAALSWLLAACAVGGAVVSWSRDRVAAFTFATSLATSLVLVATLFTFASWAISDFEG